MELKGRVWLQVAVVDSWLSLSYTVLRARGGVGFIGVSKPQLHLRLHIFRNDQ